MEMAFILAVIIAGILATRYTLFQRVTWGLLWFVPLLITLGHYFIFILTGQMPMLPGFGTWLYLLGMAIAWIIAAVLYSMFIGALWISTDRNYS